MAKTNLNINVLGSSLLISAEEDPEYLNRLLVSYRAKLEETKKTTGLSEPIKIAILTGFILCDEIEKTKKNADLEKQRVLINDKNNKEE